MGQALDKRDPEAVQNGVKDFINGDKKKNYKKATSPWNFKKWYALYIFLENWRQGLRRRPAIAVAHQRDGKRQVVLNHDREDGDAKNADFPDCRRVLSIHEQTFELDRIPCARAAQEFF